MGRASINEQARGKGGAWNLPNVLSILRLFIAPLLILLAVAGQRMAFMVLAAAGFLTDSVDGYLARKLNQCSPKGAVLDSLGDFCIYVSLPVCVWLLWPELVLRELPFMLMAIGGYLIPTAIGVVKYHRLTSHHTIGAKVSAVAIGLTTLLLLLDVTPWPFRAAATFLVLAGLEDTAITLILPRWQPNVPSLFHAFALRRRRRREADGKETGQ